VRKGDLPAEGISGKLKGKGSWAHLQLSKREVQPPLPVEPRFAWARRERHILDLDLRKAVHVSTLSTRDKYAEFEIGREIESLRPAPGSLVSPSFATGSSDVLTREPFISLCSARRDGHTHEHRGTTEVYRLASSPAARLTSPTRKLANSGPDLGSTNVTRPWKSLDAARLANCRWETSAIHALKGQKRTTNPFSLAGNDVRLLGLESSERFREEVWLAREGPSSHA
jgi:hypothetical protein